MSLQKLDQPIEEPAGEGVRVLVTDLDVRAAPSRARVSVYHNERPLTTDLVRLDRQTERHRLAKAAQAADTEGVVDPALLEETLLRCAEVIHQEPLALLPATAAGKDGDERPIKSADFPGLVDVVVDEESQVAFLVRQDGEPLGVALTFEYQGQDVRLVPPQLSALPWRLPRASEVLGYLGAGGSESSLFEALVAALKAHAFLPQVPGLPDAYYLLLAAWVMHTHYLEPAAYSPIIAFYAVPERGKSRLGRTLTYMARHGVHTETLREANLIRDAQHRKATIFLDCLDLWAKAQKANAEDLILQRFERGAKVTRVLYPDKGPFDDTVYYDTFGATLIATNKPLDRILDTRCLHISMPLAPRGATYPVPSEEALLPLRERLTAWRAKVLLADWQPTLTKKPAAGRLGDVLLPLVQIVARVAPRHLETVYAFARYLEGERARERELSWEATVMRAVASLSDKVNNGLLRLDAIVRGINLERSPQEQVNARRVGTGLRALGFQTRSGTGNKTYLVWDPDKVERLVSHYSLDDETVSSQEAPAGDVNFLTYVNSAGAGPGTEAVKEGKEVKQLAPPTADVTQLEGWCSG